MRIEETTKATTHSARRHINVESPEKRKDPFMRDMPQTGSGAGRVVRGAIAMAALISTSTLAQAQYISQQTGDTAQAGLNTLAASSNGATSSGTGSQTAVNATNQLGSGATGYIPTLVLTIYQAINGYLTQSAANAATGSGQSVRPLITGSQLNGSSQSAINAGNGISVGAPAGVALALQQAANFSAASTQSAVNSLAAQASLGQASIGGTGNSQQAVNTLNAISLEAPDPGATVRIDQTSQNSAPLTVTTQNSADAGVMNAPIGTNAARISQLNQTSSTSVNTLASTGDGALNLGVGSNGVGQNSAPNATLTRSNVALVYAGTFAGSAEVNTGSTAVTGVTQSTAINLNTVNAKNGLNLGDSAAPFAQLADSASLSVKGYVGNALLQMTDVSSYSNVIGAITKQGSADVTGTPLSQTNSTATQSNVVSINAMSTQGAVGGGLTQAANMPSPLSPNQPGTTEATLMTNIVSAAVSDCNCSNVAPSGSARIVNVSQLQSLNANTVAGASGTSLGVQQTANGNGTAHTLGGSNQQISSTLNGSAYVINALQQGGGLVNSANLGVLTNGALSQASSGVGQTLVNRVSSIGNAAISTGSQSANQQTNQLR